MFVPWSYEIGKHINAIQNKNLNFACLFQLLYKIYKQIHICFIIRSKRNKKKKTIF